MPGRALIGQEFRIDAFAVIAHAKLEALLTVAELHLDTARLGMTEGVSQGFARDPIDLIADERPLLSRGAFDGQAYFGTTAMGGIAREFFRECLDGFAEFVRLDCGGP